MVLSVVEDFMNIDTSVNRWVVALTPKQIKRMKRLQEDLNEAQKAARVAQEEFDSELLEIADPEDMVTEGATTCELSNEGKFLIVTERWE